MPVNYQLGKIYKIVNTVNNIIYIGSTAQRTLAVRMCGHRRDAENLTKASKWNVAMRSIGIEKFKIVLIHLFPCNSKDELEAEEYKVMNAEIAAGAFVYNSKVDKTGLGYQMTDVAKKKISEALFKFGSIKLRADKRRWQFHWMENGTLHSKSFACKKYGEYGAFFRVEEVRREVYPEWGNDEDIYCDDLGHIEW